MAGPVSLWGDFGVHFTMGSGMAYRSLLLKVSPLLINSPFVYPFAADLLSAILIRLGVPFFASFTIPSFLFCVASMPALFYFYKEFFKSERIAILGSLIFFFNGGLGFLQFLKDFFNSSYPLTVLLRPPAQYTHLDDWHIVWHSVIETLFIPQRAFALAFPLTLVG